MKIFCLIAIILSYVALPACALDASWMMGATTAREEGLRCISGADGVYEHVMIGGKNAIKNSSAAVPLSNFLYFQCLEKLKNPLYVKVEYFDNSVNGSISLQYDTGTGTDISTRYVPAEQQVGGLRLDTGKWKSAIFRLNRAGFAHRQNLGADFRLSGNMMFVGRVTVSESKPSNWEAIMNEPVPVLKQLVHIGAGGQLIVGGFDPARLEDAAGSARALENAVPILRQMGVTSHEVYVRWNLCELSEGKYDWSVYDRYVAVYKKYGLKWVPFLIVGSPYSLPDWYYKKAGYQGYVCLEHGQESDVQSLWNPTLRKHVSRFINAFCERYRGSGVIESILLGITGNYGEAIYPVTGNDWTADIHGAYHTHPGFWAGDKYAQESFRLFLIRKYGGTTPLRDAWGKTVSSFEEIKPFMKEAASNERSWLDMCDWYINSMTDWSRFWISETRKSFPGDIYLCTGGDAPIRHGSDFGEQCKVAAEFGAGVRITNESSDEASNASLTRWVASAGLQYGAYFSFEPASGVNADGVVNRVYNATASGARGLHYYNDNLFSTPEARKNFLRMGSMMKQHVPIHEIAVYYPETEVRLNELAPLTSISPFFERFDFSYMSDGQIRDGGLKSIKALYFVTGRVIERTVLQKIADWAAHGGLIIRAEGEGALRTVEGDESFNDTILHPTGKSGRVLMFNGMANAPAYRDFVVDALKNAAELSIDTRAMISAAGAADGLFATLVKPRTLLWLNTTDKDAIRGTVKIPAHSIVEQKL